MLHPEDRCRLRNYGHHLEAARKSANAMKRRDDASLDYPDVTVPAYEVVAQIGGKLAQLGGRLIDSTAKKLASEFFASFGEVVGSAAVAGA
jgi:carbon monoxide dehydrogenase subunit G